eukprot:5121006-Alexandrium_andersonii.AAC.1
MMSLTPRLRCCIVRLRLVHRRLHRQGVGLAGSDQGPLAELSPLSQPFLPRGMCVQMMSLLARLRCLIGRHRLVH